MSHLSFSQKLILLVFAPIIGLLLFASSIAIKDSRSAADANLIYDIVELSAINSALVHELQKERGLTAGFLGAAMANSSTTRLKTQLDKQRQVTDQALQARQAFIKPNAKKFKVKELQRVTDQVAAELARLNAIRNQVNALELPVRDAIHYYTFSNKLLLETPLIAATESRFANTTKELLAYYNYLQAKERAGVERAVLSNTFAADQFGEGMYTKFVTLVTEQNLFTQAFLQTTHLENQQYFADNMKIEAVNTVNKYRKIASDNYISGRFNVVAMDWFQSATERINQLKSIEDNLTEQLLATAKETASSASRGFGLTLVTSAILIGIALLISHRLYSQITGQFRAISNAIASVVANKDLNVKIDVISSDELGTIARRFNEMVRSFSDALRICLRASEQLSARTGGSANAVNQNQTALRAQELETAQIASAVVEMATSAQEVATTANSAAETTNHVGSISTEGTKVVDSTLSTIGQLSNEIQAANGHVKQLRERSNDISSLLEVIKNVAEQTNLLALNAAIEAARAGEQGRGFAVVADEVRTLAQRTQQSTSEIEDTIQLFQNSSIKASDSMNTCVSESISAQENTGQLKVSLQNIAAEVSQLRGLTQQIATASDQQVTVSEEISGAINKINDSAQMATSGVEQLLNDSKENAFLAEDLRGLIRSFKMH